MGDRRPQVVPVAPPSPSSPGLSAAERADALYAEVPAAFRVEAFAVADPRFASVLAGGPSSVLDAAALPAPMGMELSWWVATCHATGSERLDVGDWQALLAVAAAAGVASLSELSLEEWGRRWAADFYARWARMPAVATRRRALGGLGRLLAFLRVRYSPTDWWRHDVWDPTVDARIPRRAHEPRGHQPLRFTGLHRAWLADGLKFYLRVQLETGRLSWSSAHTYRRLIDGGGLNAYVAARGIDHPALCLDPSGLRPLALDMASFVRALPRRRTTRSTSSTLAETASRTLEAIAHFYEFMADYRPEAAAALGDDRWLCLTDAHGRLWRVEETGRHGRAVGQADDDSYIAEADLARMFAHIELLGAARHEARSVVVNGEAVTVAGLGDPSAMRAWILQALTGRRAAEVLMMSFEPLSAIPGVDPSTVGDGGMVAKLAYRQTKIPGAPATILVGADVVGVVREQQAWVRERFGLAGDESIPFLFPRLQRNRHGDWARSTVAYLGRLAALDAVVQLRDAEGRPLSYSRSHRLRHTKATTLLNLGAPIHVVQRYLGHRSPEMTMRYAQTLATTAEREFLALAKVGRDGRELRMDRQDLLDLVGLERRTDRVLPNGYCLLPPTKSCDKGNACHTCDHFATDRSYLPEIHRQLADTEALIVTRQRQHAARHGEPMSEANVWLAQRRAEVGAMQREVAALEALADDAGAVRGPGVLARPGYQACPTPVQLSPRRPPR